MGEDAVQAEKSSTIASHQSQDLVVPSPSPTQSSPNQSLSRVPEEIPAEEATLVAKNDNQVNAITVLTLLDKLVSMLDTVQENQQKMELQQLDMEAAVRGIQNDMTKLSKSHTSTSNTVSKLLEKSRKVSVHMKEVRDKMDKQAVQVKKLEANHAHLLKRNNFKVLIFQEENEIPPNAFVKDPVPYPRDQQEDVSNVDVNRSQEEGLQTINLSSDEELGPDEEEEEAVLGQRLADESIQKSRAEKFKRSSLKKVDSLKKVFSRQNIEKKMTKISTKIVSPEKREKIKKSFSSNHQKNTSSSSKVPPVQKEQDAESPPNIEDSAAAAGSIELAPIRSGEDLPFTEVHSNLAPTQEEDNSIDNSFEKEGLVNLTTGCLDAELSITEYENPAYSLSATLPQEDPVPPSSFTLQELREEQEYEEEKRDSL